jgi:hypothetical protein
MSGPGGRNYMRRRDATEKVCVRTFEKLGCTVWKVDEPMDLLVWLPGHGYNGVVNCRNPEGGNPMNIDRIAAVSAAVLLALIFLLGTGVARAAGDPFDPGQHKHNIAPPHEHDYPAPVPGPAGPKGDKGDPGSDAVVVDGYGGYYIFLGAGLVTGGEGEDCSLQLVSRDRDYEDEPPTLETNSKRRRQRVREVCESTDSDELGLRVGWGNAHAFNNGDRVKLGWEFTYASLGEVGVTEVDAVDIGPALRISGLPGGTNALLKPSLVWYDADQFDWDWAAEAGIEKFYNHAFWRVSAQYHDDIEESDLLTGWISAGYRW